MKCVIRMEVLAPTIDIADLLIRNSIDRFPDLKQEIERVGADQEHILEDFFGISPAFYENGAVDGSAAYGMPDTDYYTNTRTHGKGGECVLYPDLTGISIWISAPGWLDGDDYLLITNDDLDAVMDDLPARSVSDLHPTIFNAILDGLVEAKDFRDEEECEADDADPSSLADYWITEEGNPAWFNLISSRPEEIFAISRLLANICYAPFRELLEMGGFSKTQFADSFRISYRTVDDWYYQKQQCRIYLRLLFAECMGIITRRHKV